MRPWVALVAAALVQAFGAERRAHAEGDPPGGAAKDAPPEALEVHVAGERVSTVASRDPTAASTVIRGDRLQTPGATAADVLVRVPGVQIARTGAGSDLATASIRGASSAETPVYLAGVRLNDDVTGTADLSLVPLWMVQRVEVYRGNAPEDADRLGLGGAILFEPTLPKGSRAGAGFGAGSFGELGTWGAASLGDERAGVMIALGRRAATNRYPYLDDRGTLFDPSDDRTRLRQNADVVAYDLWSIGRYELPGGGGVTAIVNGLARDQGVTGLSVIPARAARAHVQRWLGAASAVVPCARPGAGGADRCRLELATSAILSRQETRDPLRELALGSPLASSAGARAAERASLRYRLSDRLTARLSGSQEVERLRLERVGAPSSQASRATSRASASASFAPRPSLDVYALGVIERHATRAEHVPSAPDAIEPSARVGARLKLGEGAALLANVGRYARVPTLGELYGSSAVVLGNPDLRPEQGVSAEIGARLAAARRPLGELFVELVGFTRLASDLVAYQRTGLGVIRPKNVQSARILGMELTASATALDHVRAEIALTALDPRDTSAERQVANDLLPFQARLVAAPYLEIYDEALKPRAIDRLSLGARLLYRASRVADAAGLVVIPDQAIVDVELGVLLFDRRVSVRAAVDDIFNAQARDVIGLALPGRSAHAAMEVWWW